MQDLQDHKICWTSCNECVQRVIPLKSIAVLVGRKTYSFSRIANIGKSYRKVDS